MENEEYHHLGWILILFCVSFLILCAVEKLLYLYSWAWSINSDIPHNHVLIWYNFHICCFLVSIKATMYIWTHFGFCSSHFFLLFLQVTHPERLQVLLIRRGDPFPDGDSPANEISDGAGEVAIRQTMRFASAENIKWPESRLIEWNSLACASRHVSVAGVGSNCDYRFMTGLGQTCAEVVLSTHN